MKRSLRTIALAVALALGLSAVAVSPAVARTATTGTLSIKVVAPGGTPLPNVSVDAYGASDPWDSAYGSTNASGVFKTSELAPGNYTVTASLYWPVEASETKKFTVTANKDTAVTITLSKVQAIKGTVKAGTKAITKGTVSAWSSKDYYSADIVKGSYLILAKAGTYTVQAYTYPTTSWLTTFAGNTVREPDAKKVTVTAGKVATADIAVYTKVGKISGRVLDANGKAVKGASVSANAKNRAGYAYTTTDAKGSYTLVGLPADDYTVYASNSTYTATGSVATKTVTVGKTATATIKIKSIPTGTAKVAVTLTAPSALVKANRACVVLLDAKGNIYNRGGSVAGGSLCLPSNGKSKTVTFDKLPAGTYKVAASGANTSKSVKAVKGKTTKVSLTRPAGTTISGKIATSGGTLLANTWVEILDGNGTWLGSAQTNSKGSYSISGAVKGKYTVTASPDKPAQGARTSKTVTVASSKLTVNMRLIKAATIVGKVVNSKGKPVAGVSVTTNSGNSWANTTTDAKGNYTLTGLAAGTYQVTTYDPWVGGYFNGTAPKKSVATGKKVTASTIKLKG